MRKLSWSEKWIIVLTVLFSAAMLMLYLHMTRDDGNADYTISTERGGMTMEQYQGLPVDINSADLSDLMTLDGIGPELAKRIIDYREEHGGFETVEELMQVEGIGWKKFAGMENRVICEEAKK